MTENTKKKGTLAVVGTGISALGQMTVETVGWFKTADVVFYLVSDPLTVRWICEKSPDAINLKTHYGEYKPRKQSYDEMVHAIMQPVREGKKVCAAFYGHPGVFAFPPHESVRRAKAEGHDAFMLPGISAADCLFADLGIDPATSDCQMIEATKLMIDKDVSLRPHAHVLLWQIGCVGHVGFNRAGYNQQNWPILVELLRTTYPQDHLVTIYYASTLPLTNPSIREVRVSELVDCTVNAAETMYIPPIHKSMDLDFEMMERLGVEQSENGELSDSFTRAHNQLETTENL